MSSLRPIGNLRDVPRASVAQIVMTRINLNRGFGDDRAIVPAWIDRKLDLFEVTALPCMQSQSVTDWNWILLASIDTPPRQRERLDAYAEDDRLAVAYIDAYGPAVFAGVTGDLASEVSTVVTTRLDADDVIAGDFLAAVRAVATHRDGTFFVNLDDGLRFDVATGALYRYRHRSNMFLSLVEPTSSMVRTVLSYEHPRAAEHHNVVHVSGPPRWVQVLHDANLVSTLGSHRRVRKGPLVGRFSSPLLASSVQDRPLQVIGEVARFAIERGTRRVGKALDGVKRRARSRQVGGC